jgi:hypothetical protein
MGSAPGPKVHDLTHVIPLSRAARSLCVGVIELDKSESKKRKTNDALRDAIVTRKS